MNRNPFVFYETASKYCILDSFADCGYFISFKGFLPIVIGCTDFILGVPKSLQMVTVAMKLKDTYSLEGKL